MPTRNPFQSLTKFSVDESIADGLATFGSAVKDGLEEGENYIRREPVSAALWAMLGGYLLRFFPFKTIFRTFVVLVAASIRPLAFLYLLAKAFEVSNCSRKHGDTPDEARTE